MGAPGAAVVVVFLLFFAVGRSLLCFFFFSSFFFLVWGGGRAGSAHSSSARLLAPDTSFARCGTLCPLSSSMSADGGQRGGAFPFVGELSEWQPCGGDSQVASAIRGDRPAPKSSLAEDMRQCKHHTNLRQNVLPVLGSYV